MAPINWIDCNLPWETHSTAQFVLPDLSEEAKALFGYTREELDAQISPAYVDHTNNVRNEIDEALGEVEDYTVLLREKLEEIAKTDPIVAATLAWRKKRRELDDWINEHPATQMAIEKWNAAQELEKQKSFCGRKLNRPGTLIEVQTNDDQGEPTVSRFLIGNLNPGNGCCGCCSLLADSDIVLRYAVIYDPSESINT